MENPFSLKVGQVFTGFGVGCGIGIGVGRPIYFGIALKPGVLHQIQSDVTDSVINIIKNMGLAPNLTSIKNFATGSFQRDAATRNLKSWVGGPMDLAFESAHSTFQSAKQDGSIHHEAASNGSFRGTPLGTRAEKVIDNFLQSPNLKNEAEANLDELARNLRAENNMLQLLLRHQELMEELLDENRRVQKVLMEDLGVAPEKLRAAGGAGTKWAFSSACADCFECRRRARKLRR